LSSSSSSPGGGSNVGGDVEVGPGPADLACSGFVGERGILGVGGGYCAGPDGGMYWLVPSAYFPSQIVSANRQPFLATNERIQTFFVKSKVQVQIFCAPPQRTNNQRDQGQRWCRNGAGSNSVNEIAHIHDAVSLDGVGAVGATSRQQSVAKLIAARFFLLDEIHNLT